VEAVLLGDSSERDELIGSDLARGDARHDGIGAVALDVGEIAVVRVLEAGVLLLEDVVVPRGREDRRDGRLADLTTLPAAMLADQVLEGANAPDAHEVIELLARVREVLAEVIVDGDPRAGELRLEQVGDQRGARAAAGPGLRALLDGRELREALLPDGFADRALGDVVSRANERRIAEGVDAGAGGGSRFHRRQEQGLGVLSDVDAVLDVALERAVRRSVPDEDAAEQAPLIGAQDELLVDASDPVEEADDARSRRARERVAEAADIDAEELQLGAEVELAALGVLAGERPRDHLGHAIPRRDQAVRSAAQRRALANREDGSVARSTAGIDDDAAPLADGERRVACQLVPRPDPGR